MAYDKNALSIHDLPRITQGSITDLLLIETLSADNAIAYGDLLRNAATVFYGFYIDSNGHLNVDIIDTGSYNALNYKEWYIGGAATTFSITASGTMTLAF